MLIPVYEHAERFFIAQRPGSWVPGYFSERGFDEDVQHQWKIGYASGTWTALTRHLRGLGFSDRVIEASGLAHRSRRGGLIDVFRDRAMFPVKLADGTTIAFVGRSRRAGPKYINSPETPIYNKGSVLFGLHRVRADLRPVIVEGPLDAMAVSVAAPGEFTGVALCGTALTSRQVVALAEVSDHRPLLALDGDHAGQNAAIKAYPLLDADAVRLPAGSDPCDLVSTNDLGAALRRAQPLADLVVDAAIRPWEGSLQFPEGTVGAMRAAAGAIVRLRRQDVARQVDRVATRLGLSHPEVTEAVVDHVISPDRARLAREDFPTTPRPSSTSAITRGKSTDERHRVSRRPTS